MAEQRYQAVLAVIAGGRTVTEVAGQWKVSRQTLHEWLRRFTHSRLHGHYGDVPPVDLEDAYYRSIAGLSPEVAAEPSLH